jgi:hypothetical protein
MSSPHGTLARPLRAIPIRGTRDTRLCAGSLPRHGAHAAIMVGDKIAFKSMYGFVTGSPEGITADTPTVSAAEQYTIGIPGQEVGLAATPGLQYGQTITLRNPMNEFLQSDPNGWVYLRGSNGDWNHFDVLSPLHRQGLVEYGDDVILRAHNTTRLSSNGDGELLATQLIPDENCIFTLIGRHGGLAIHCHGNSFFSRVVLSNASSCAIRFSCAWLLGSQLSITKTKLHFVGTKDSSTLGKAACERSSTRQATTSRPTTSSSSSTCTRRCKL